MAKIIMFIRVQRIIKQFGCWKTLVIFLGMLFSIVAIVKIETWFSQVKDCLPLSRMEELQDNHLCHGILNGYPDAIAYANEFTWCRREDAKSESYYIEAAEDCQKLLVDYNTYKVTPEEKRFPLAFSITMHDDVEQTLRMLRLIYRPHNFYCIAVDAKASIGIHRAINTIAACFDNLVVSEKAISIVWGTFSVLEADLTCLRQLFTKFKDWKYYMNLVGTDFPIMSNKQLVKAFRVYKGANDIQSNYRWMDPNWFGHGWADYQHNMSYVKDDPPHGLHIVKGSTHVAASRAFVNYALYNQTAIDLLRWLKDAKVPDEHFFSTLNHNPAHAVPGSYTGQRTAFSLIRYKLWKFEQAMCNGEWVRGVCSFGVGDLHDLVRSKAMFANKIRLHQDPIAFRCLELWQQDRIEGKWMQEHFDISYYRNLPFVKHHVK